MKIEWFEKEGVAQAVSQEKRDSMIREAAESCLKSETGIVIQMTGDAVIVVTTEGDGVVSIYDCTLRREGEAECDHDGRNCSKCGTTA